jgi:hypothetical protein
VLQVTIGVGHDVLAVLPPLLGVTHGTVFRCNDDMNPMSIVVNRIGMTAGIQCVALGTAHGDIGKPFRNVIEGDPTL